MTALGWGLVALAYVLGFASYWGFAWVLARVIRGRHGDQAPSQMVSVMLGHWYSAGLSDDDIRAMLAYVLRTLDGADAEGGPS